MKLFFLFKKVEIIDMLNFRVFLPLKLELVALAREVKDCVATEADRDTCTSQLIKVDKITSKVSRRKVRANQGVF